MPKKNHTKSSLNNNSRRLRSLWRNHQRSRHRNQKSNSKNNHLKSQHHHNNNSNENKEGKGFYAMKTAATATATKTKMGAAAAPGQVGFSVRLLHGTRRAKPRLSERSRGKKQKASSRTAKPR